MYPRRELIRLGVHKAVLRRRIARHRLNCAEAAVQVTRPLEWLDRAVSLWRRLSPYAALAAVPLGLLIKRKAFPKLNRIGLLLKWAPIIFGILRGRAVATRGESNSDRSESDSEEEEFLHHDSRG